MWKYHTTFYQLSDNLYRSVHMNEGVRDTNVLIAKLTYYTQKQEMKEKNVWGGKLFEM